MVLRQQKNVTQESIQIQKQSNESYNIHQHNDEKIVNKNGTSNGLSSNDPVDPTHPTQEGQDAMNNKSPEIQVQNNTSVDTGDIGDIIVQPSQKEGLYDKDYVNTMPSLQSPKPVMPTRSNDDTVNPLKEG
jgi:hypothetical protein